MSPIDKAFQLVVNMQLKQYGVNKFVAKQCALIAVTEIINANPHSNPLNTTVHSTMSYWLEVNEELQKL
jgi:hypothetical protein